MEQDRIRELLEKYENAESSLEEEAILAQYFKTADKLPEDLLPYKAYFRWTQEFKLEGSSQRLNDSINNITELKGPERRSTAFISITRWTKWAAAAAAVILVVFIWQTRTGNNGFDPNSNLVYQETFDDPEKAYEQTLEALAFMSTKLNRGQAKAANSMKKLKELDQAIPSN